MSNSIDLKKGLNIPISGAADLRVKDIAKAGTVAIQPSDFKGLNPRLLVKEGDKVLAGSPVLADKKNTDILITSPVSGTVEQIVRGDKRKLLAVLVKADAAQEYVDFGKNDPAKLSAEQVKEVLLKSGLWAGLIQRPYGILADPAAAPKGIFISAFSTAPLAADTEFTLASELAAMQAGVTALAKLAPVHVSVNSSKSAFAGMKDATVHLFTGKHPAGNVGVQISHISHIRKEETVWTVSAVVLAAIGKLFTQGKLELSRKVAVTGPAAIEPAYVEVLPGTPMKSFEQFYGSADGLRVISGDVLTGRNAGVEGYLGFFDTQVCIIREGNTHELLGWARPLRLNQFSSTRSYFSWLCPKKQYDMDTNLHGGPRAFLMSDSYYADVLPMDIYPLYLTKACLAGDIEKMEKFGIYEVLPEDLALCEFVDPSKNYIQDIIAKGIDLMLKEMA
ncbi:MAG: Na(+)-translocating NADH-quinone reductase subunit A [Bacteroidales bacterium]|nr:Na(+)-translocating NADH-quinone reductase subunit A [Bacteroidales bacterium]MCI5618315.1 Na(+)-translocating NADH-quinone reductase subunit A [Rikenellaceae bacterium]